jgi:hypothetical protein
VASTDIHQHLWPPAFFSALSARSEPPRLRGRALELAGAPVWDLNVESHELDERLALLDRLGLECAVVSLQPTLGIDRLHADEARELFDAWEEGILQLARAAKGRILPLAAREPGAGFAGLCVSGAALLDLDGLAPRLDSLAQSGGFLFVHPGVTAMPPGAPPWWTAVVDYTAEMQAAYVNWLATGAERWPDLDVVFAILAGGAPIQLERLASRGVDTRAVLHEHVYFDTASYGDRALELSMATFGVGQLVYGSDWPVIDSEATLRSVRGFGQAVTDAVCRDNPARLLQ